MKLFNKKSKVRVAINGFGRIGRAFLKIALDKDEIEIVAVNDLGSIESLTYLLKYDTVYGNFKKEVSNDGQNIIIDGKKIAEEIREGLKKKISKLKQRPGLAVVLVGDNPASQVYVNMKEKKCNEVGFYSKKIVLPENTSQEELLDLVNKLNQDQKIHGMLVQLPLPNHINPQLIIDAILQIGRAHV